MAELYFYTSRNTSLVFPKGILMKEPYRIHSLKVPIALYHVTVSPFVWLVTGSSNNRNGVADSCEFASNKYYALCGLGGILSCGITHTLVTPLDLVKCRLQVDPAKYKNVVHGFKVKYKFHQRYHAPYNFINQSPTLTSSIFHSRSILNFIATFSSTDVRNA